MSKTIAQIYSLTNLADALMCVELGAQTTSVYLRRRGPSGTHPKDLRRGEIHI